MMAELGQAGIAFVGHDGSSCAQPARTATACASSRRSGDGCAQAAHQVLIILHIVPGEQHRPEHLLRLEQMVQIGAAVARAGRAAARRVQRRGIVGEARVAQVEHAARGVGARGAAGARRDHAVEHVDAALHRADDVVRRAHAHQVARRIRRQVRHGRIEHREGGGLAFADRQPADRIAVEADVAAARARMRRAGPDRCCPARCRTAP